MLARLICFFLFFFNVVNFAHATPLSMDVQHANLPDALYYLAQFLKVNVMISPSVQGFTTLSLQKQKPSAVFNALLTANGLGVWKIGSIWWIASQDEIVKRKQEAIKWEEDYAALNTHRWKIKYAKAEDIVRLLQSEHASLLSKRGYVRADVRTNIIYSEETPLQLERLSQFIHYLDVPVPQIAIAARLVSVDSDFERELGLNFSVQSSTAKEISAPTTATSTNSDGGHYSLAIAKLADGALLDVKLAALENAGHAEIISSPRLFTANQQSASIEAGEEVPYQEVSESGGTATAFKKAVLALKVTPQVLPNNKVLLQLQISQDRPNSKTVLGMPTISTRQIITNVLAKHGQTIVLGGIYETIKEKGEQRMPFISKLPVLGWLFKQQDIRENKRELLIFVTPSVIET